MWVFCWIHVRRHTWLSHSSLFLKKTNKRCAIVCVFCQASWHYEPTLYSAFEWAHFANVTSSKPLALLQTHINMLPPPCFKVRPMQSLWHSLPGPHQTLKSRQMAFCFIWIKNVLLVLIRLSFVRRNCAILCPLIRKSPLLSGLMTAKADSYENLLFQYMVVKIANCTPTHSWGQPTSFQGFTSSGSLYFIIPGQKRERKKAVWSFLLKSCEIQKLWTACVITFVTEFTDKQTFGAMVLVKHFPL